LLSRSWTAIHHPLSPARLRTFSAFGIDAKPSTC
jgi:hypothetical protein